MIWEYSKIAVVFSLNNLEFFCLINLWFVTEILFNYLAQSYSTAKLKWFMQVNLQLRFTKIWTLVALPNMFWLGRLCCVFNACISEWLNSSAVFPTWSLGSGFYTRLYISRVLSQLHNFWQFECDSVENLLAVF